MLRTGYCGRVELLNQLTCIGSDLGSWSPDLHRSSGARLDLAAGLLLQAADSVAALANDHANVLAETSITLWNMPPDNLIYQFAEGLATVANNQLHLGRRHIQHGVPDAWSCENCTLAPDTVWIFFTVAVSPNN